MQGKAALVRIPGLNVGKVKAKEPDVENNATTVTIELDPKFAPIPANTRALVRIKALLGETYVVAGSRPS